MKKSVLSVAALALLLGYAAVSQTSALPKHHVVFQLSEPDGDAWGSLVLHVNNTMKSLAEDVWAVCADWVLVRPNMPGMPAVVAVTW